MDRKALARQYKETKRPVGVFCVRNRINGKALIGVSIDLPSMLNRQRAQLGMGLHPNRALQDDWNTLGSAAFDFEVLDTLDPPDRADWDPADDLRVLEKLWLEKLAPFGERGYHAVPKPAAPREG
jgi:hypothetical protein